MSCDDVPDELDCVLRASVTAVFCSVAGTTKSSYILSLHCRPIPCENRNDCARWLQFGTASVSPRGPLDREDCNTLVCCVGPVSVEPCQVRAPLVVQRDDPPILGLKHGAA